MSDEPPKDLLANAPSTISRSGANANISLLKTNVSKSESKPVTLKKKHDYKMKPIDMTNRPQPEDTTPTIEPSTGKKNRYCKQIH